uniref:Uncharacterized protein n=1 Tax=Rhizophora mucronata TaxID=61149 RepID=A0A2P2N2J2_RHIMU
MEHYRFYQKWPIILTPNMQHINKLRHCRSMGKNGACTTHT